jgi:hypothetical protein
VVVAVVSLVVWVAIGTPSKPSTTASPPPTPTPPSTAPPTGAPTSTPPSTENDFYLMAAAVIAIAAGSIMSWGAGLAVAIAAAGVTALVYSQTVPADLRTGEFITASVCFGLLAMGIAIGWAALRGAAAKRRAIEEQMAEETRREQRAMRVAATVTALRDTGTTVDDNPQAAIMVRYARRDGTTFEVETVQVAPPGNPATR